MDSLRLWLPRILGSVVAALSGPLGTWLGREISPSDQDFIVSIAVGVCLLIYSAVHKIVSSKMNPADVASKDQLTH